MECVCVMEHCHIPTDLEYPTTVHAGPQLEKILVNFLHINCITHQFRQFANNILAYDYLGLSVRCFDENASVLFANIGLSKHTDIHYGIAELS